mmetsp:Transcript_18127/g.19643  ORF Transcript_18127/g.19643 Transcript_18127/m.19643 type:complete len:1074 (+) Transcript_18127:71-3292(+)
MADNKPKSFARRDHLRANERRIQAKWEEEKLYFSTPEPGKEKFMVTFPYPYMNGKLHLGHAFSLTKAEFTARFQRMLGKNVLFPFGFHCTGMPIQAAANKLKEEIEKYGNPPNFTEEDETPKEGEAPPAPPAEEANTTANADGPQPQKGRGKKTKLVVKGQAGKNIRQWDILAKMVPEEIIPEFVDPIRWVNYFSPLGMHDLKKFGAAIDWRRSFVTTSHNPYYDAFIRWQFNQLKETARVKSGYRPSIYSVKDAQVCADHDRASGEGVIPQEYTLIKLRVVDTSKHAVIDQIRKQFPDSGIYLVAATLRPETMYGQTNCFVLPEGNYGAYVFQNQEIFVMSERSAIGLAHQGYAAADWGKIVQVGRKFTGQEIIGLPLEPPLSQYRLVYTLPLITISMGKGTGVVTSVPSDAPDDYIALKELKDKPLWREKFGVTEEMVAPFSSVPIIDIPGYGVCSAANLCEEKEVKSSKDYEKLKAIKEEVYLKGFYEGVLQVGPYAGQKVCDAKPIIRNELIQANLSLPYFEPESTVMSRSGDECIVALTDQWYLTYSDADWKERVVGHLNSGNFNMYNQGIRDAMFGAVDWLKEWACSREFGLGTKLPWDQKWVIDSLSDSTIYMAYYTIAHLWHASGDLSGNSEGNPDASLFTDEVFSYIFLGKELPADVGAKFPAQFLEKLREEFLYWYPLDLRVSAKDLIPNHLMMSLYNHAEIWKDTPELWPRGMYCNGHVLVDAEKMSKSKGNFILMEEGVEEYSADAMRFALADAGDGLEDANFDRSVANQAISYLFVEEEWVKSVLPSIAQTTSNEVDTSSFSFMERIFDNEMHYLIAEAKKDFLTMNYREGIHRAWYDMMIIRDLYRDWAQRTGRPMHPALLRRFIESVALMMQPITPHWSEIIYELLTAGQGGSVVTQSWPAYQPSDPMIRKQFVFFKNFLKTIRAESLKQKNVRQVLIFTASSYTAKRVVVLQYMQTQCDASGKFAQSFIKDLRAFIESTEELKGEMKEMMQFGSFIRDEAEDRGVDALAVTLSFDQIERIDETSPLTITINVKLLPNTIPTISPSGDSGFVAIVSWD